MQLVASELELNMTSLALQHVSQRRPSAVPSPGQVRDLRRWEAQLRVKKVEGRFCDINL